MEPQVWDVHTGLVPFTDIEGAAEAIRAVDADYERHSRAARELAETFFSARRCCRVCSRPAAGSPPRSLGFHHCRRGDGVSGTGAYVEAGGILVSR